MLIRLDTIYTLARRKNLHELCTREYPNHKRGCPNFNSKDTCPPKQKLLHEVFALCEPCYFVINCFEFGRHVAFMRIRHPDWSDRQLRNCLYWQGTARMQLKHKIKGVLQSLQGYSSHMCPEAMGINVTATCAHYGLILEWPPQVFAYQVAFIGMPLEGDQ